MKTFVFAVAALVAVQAGFAQAQTESREEVVPVLSSGSPVEANRILDRLRTAALDVCGAPFGSDRGYVRTVEASACYREALARAVSQVGSQAVRDAFAAEPAPKSSWKFAARP
jgi:UrcA family protein